MLLINLLFNNYLDRLSKQIWIEGPLKIICFLWNNYKIISYKTNHTFLTVYSIAFSKDFVICIPINSLFMVPLNLGGFFFTDKKLQFVWSTSSSKSVLTSVLCVSMCIVAGHGEQPKQLLQWGREAIPLNHPLYDVALLGECLVKAICSC